MVAMPGQLFYSTQIPVCLWFVARSKSGRSGLRGRRGQTLFVDARRLGTLIDRVHRELSEEDIRRIADAYQAWTSPTSSTPSTRSTAPYQDVPGFCKSAQGDIAGKYPFIKVSDMNLAGNERFITTANNWTGG